MARIITFGELMLRLQPYNYERFVQCDHVEFTFGGGLIYSLLSGKDTQAAVEFAVAASALKHSLGGDALGYVSIGELLSGLSTEAMIFQPRNQKWAEVFHMADCILRYRQVT